MGIKLTEMSYEQIVAHKTEQFKTQIMDINNFGDGNKKVPCRYPLDSIHEYFVD
jgi:hypothetical protein